MRNIVETPSKDFKLLLVPPWNGSGPSQYSKCYDNKNPNVLENFQFEDDLIFDCFYGKEVRLKSLDDRFSFKMTRNDFAKLLKTPEFIRFVTDKLVFVCTFTFVIRWGSLYIKPLGV